MKLSIKGERDKQLSYAFIGLASLLVLSGVGNVLTGSLAWYFATTQKTVTTPMTYTAPAPDSGLPVPETPSEHAVSSAPSEASASVVSSAALPAALQSLRNRTVSPEPAPTSALGMLQKARQRPVTTESDQQGDENAGGESMNLEMHVSERADGGLSITTAGHPSDPEHAAETHRVSRQLAQEEENILRHREPDDPGYSDYDQHYDDREPDL